MTRDAGRPRDEGAATATASSVEGTVSTKSSAGLDVGGRLGHFRVEARIGEGGLGIVYRAYDEKLKRAVALKVLAERSGAPAARLLEEARAAASIAHASIAAIYDVQQHDGVAFIVMELVPGAPLRAEIRRGKIDWKTAARYARDIAGGLARAHQSAIVHRDLKPENVMITPDGAAKILDFGLARAATDSPPSSREVGTAMLTGIAGTPDYMAPEQTRGRRVDARADIFSFGVVLYEMLAGQRPFAKRRLVAPDDANGPVSDEWRVGVPIEQAAPGTPPPLARIVERCLSFSRAERFEDGAELLEALRAADDDARSGGPSRSSGWTRAAVVIAGLAVAGLGVLGLRWALEKRVPAALTPPPTGSTSGAPSAARPVLVTDLPVPASSSSAAADAFREGLAAERDGNSGKARLSFRAATGADPAMAAAWLRLALARFFYTDDSAKAREDFGHVGQLVSSLSDHDRAIFDAAAPLILRDPADWSEHLARLRSAIERFPTDAEIATLLANSLSAKGQWEEASAACDRATALDPRMAHPYLVKSLARAMLGDAAGALATADACEASIPASTECTDARQRIHEQSGDCAAMEADGRASVLRDPASGGYSTVAEALASEDRSVETIQGALDLYLASLPAELRPKLVALYAFLLGTWRGDFVAAEEGLKKFTALTGGDPREEEQGVPLIMRAALYEEEGRAEEARRIAAQFVEKQPTWLAYKRYTAEGLVFTGVPEMLTVARTPASSAELDARRDRWARDWADHVDPATRSAIWLAAYAGPVKNAEDARHALEVLPAFQPLPAFRPNTMWTAAEGHVYLLAGDPARAAPLLESGSHVCISIHDPFNRPQTRLALGNAREALGDRERACEAYAGVIAQWGKAKPRSVTAAAAAARATALRCPP